MLTQQDRENRLIGYGVDLSGMKWQNGYGDWFVSMLEQADANSYTRINWDFFVTDMELHRRTFDNEDQRIDAVLELGRIHDAFWDCKESILAGHNQ